MATNLFAGYRRQATPGSVRNAAVVLRPATASDAVRIHEVERSCFPSPWSLESFLVLIQRRDVEVWVIEEAPGEAPGEVIGYVVWWTVAGEGEVANLAVHPDFRARGLGARLLDLAVGKMETEGAQAVFLEVRASNASARSLYESRQFELVAVRPAYYRKPVEDALIMSRPLGRDGVAD